MAPLPVLGQRADLEMTSNNPFYIFNKITEGKLTNAYVEIRTMRAAKKPKTSSSS